MSKDIEIYQGYRIEINSVPEAQFDFDDFGWAFQVYEDSLLCFRMVIKTAGGGRTEANKSHALNWGKEKTHVLIDEQRFENGTTYCYEWGDISHNLVPEKVDCEGFLVAR